MQSAGYQRLRRKIIVTTLCFSLLPLFTLGLSIYRQLSVSYTAKIMESLRNLSENRRNSIDLFFDERVSQLNTLAYTHSLDRLSDEHYLDRVFTLMQSRAKSYVDLGVIDQQGNHVAYVGPYRLKGLNYSNEDWFHAVMLRGIFISDVFTGFRRYPHFIIAVLRREGDRTWILRATIDTEIFEAMVKAAQVGAGGDAFVINKEGLLQTTPRFGGQLSGRANIPVPGVHVGTVVEEQIHQGDRALYATTWLRSKEWLLVIKADPREELTALSHARATTVVIVLLGVLSIVFGTVFVSRLMIAQLVEADRQKALLDASLMQSSKMAALGKLAAGVAHEINNPLAVIKEKVGWMKDLLGEEDLSASPNFKEFEDAVLKIDCHVDRAKKVTHRLLGFARRMEPVQERVEVNRLIEETLDFLRNEARHRNIEIKTNFQSDLPPTLSDTSQIQQVLLNILDNSIDAIAKDGVITVETACNWLDKEIAIHVSDSGPGIPEELLQRVFDPFFTTKEAGSGTGLGLSISYSIVEKLGGRISVASQKGKGATFTIRLPVIAVEKVG